jgi:hypothetical protein
VEVVAVQEISAAKWGYVTRRIGSGGGTAGDRAGLTLGDAIAPPKLGDFVFVKVSQLGEHEFLEDVHGRRVRLYPGDIIVGAYGNRYATDFYEGYVPGPGDEVHMLTSGGLIGTVASTHTSKGAPTLLEVLGPVVREGETTEGGADGTTVSAALNTDDFAVAPSPTGSKPELGTIVVVGSAMNAGKTTTTAAVVRGLFRAGLTVGAAKVTGSGSGKDHWAYVDAGAAIVTDFLDFGMPSTFGYPVERLVSTLHGIRDRLTEAGCDAVVLEIADGVLQDETRALVKELPTFADEVILCVGDALGAVAGLDVLRELGVNCRSISGLVTASPLASREVAAATGLPVLTPGELAGGAAVDLLATVPEGLTGTGVLDDTDPTENGVSTTAELAAAEEDLANLGGSPA